MGRKEDLNKYYFDKLVEIVGIEKARRFANEKDDNYWLIPRKIFTIKIWLLIKFPFLLIYDLIKPYKIVFILLLILLFFSIFFNLIK